MVQKEKVENIAKILNIAETPVKRFFYSPEKLHSDTFREIMSVLAEYYPEDLRSIVKSDYRDILFILRDHNLMVASDIIKYLQKITLKYNISIRLYENSENIPLNILINKNKKKWSDIRGIISLSTETEEITNDFLIPTVFLNMPQQEYGLNIDVNDYLGGKLAIEHLYENNWRNPAFVGHYELSGDIIERYEGVKTACENLNIDCKLFNTYNFSMEESYNTTKKILQDKTIDSIFYFCDQMAIGGIKAINEYGYEMGKDIGVIGFDNLEISEFLGLSSMDQKLYEKILYSIEYILFGNGKPFTEKSPLISYTPEVAARKSSLRK